MAEAAGLRYSELLKLIVEAAQERSPHDTVDTLSRSPSGVPNVPPHARTEGHEIGSAHCITSPVRKFAMV